MLNGSTMLMVASARPEGAPAGWWNQLAAGSALSVLAASSLPLLYRLAKLVVRVVVTAAVVTAGTFVVAIAYARRHGWEIAVTVHRLGHG